MARLAVRCKREKFFVKGVNWMPVDALYDLTVEKYDWAVKMARNMGIQMFRIWGSGLLESDAFMMHVINMV